MKYLLIQPELMISKGSLTLGFNFHWINHFSYDLIFTTKWDWRHHLYKDKFTKSRDIYLGFIKIHLYQTFDGGN